LEKSVPSGLPLRSIRPSEAAIQPAIARVQDELRERLHRRLAEASMQRSATVSSGNYGRP